MRPELAGLPLGVVQYNPYGDLASHAADEDRLQPASNGCLIAVSYEAKAKGVKRYRQKVVILTRIPGRVRVDGRHSVGLP